MDCRGIKFADFALYQDEEEKLVFPFALNTRMKPMSISATVCILAMKSQKMSSRIAQLKSTSGRLEK